jgi:magnesium chelatase subunit D
VSQALDHRAIAELRNPLMKGLACAALSSGLRSLLVFDASPSTLQTMAGLLAQMVAVITGGEVVSPQSPESQSEQRIVPIQLGTVETEEELWGSLSLGQNITARTVVWKPGLLAAGRGQETRIVVIPDLSRLSLAASRACVMLMGAEVANLERHGQHDHWQPQLYWLAGCDRTRIGTLSPHLLDRFALRLSGGEDSQNSAQRVAQLRRWFEQFDQKPYFEEMAAESLSLSDELVDCLKEAQLAQPEVLPEAQARVLDYVELTDGYSTRRDLALLRLAKVIAQLQGFTKVTEEGVDEAAAMIGLRLQQQQPEMPLPDTTEPEPEPKEDTPQPDSSALNRDQSQATGKAPPSVKEEPVFKSDTEETLPSTSLPMGPPLENPYLEDTAEPEREAASLRLPPRRFKSASIGRGAIIGVEPATVPQDLALVNTLLEAAKYQKLRWEALQEKQDQSEWARRWLEKRAANGHMPLILQSSDLRRYRRAAVPEQMLTLVLDYTSLKECQWQEALLPYLQWAYVERASVCLVQVGVVDAQNELRAEKREADNILVPRFRNRLEASWGRATPLAHGLDLALQVLRHGLQHGRSAAQKAVLVVISDGRGNVPLAASRARKVTPPVGRQGIEDALEVARQIAALKDVEAVVLNPQPKHYADLPVELAQALGAKIAKIPTLKAWEVEVP